jgi:dephospho-CoA kinase
VSHWPGKFVIGLTGNIATGKSVVRRMLEHLGAYSIDADALAHRATTKGAPGYQPTVDLFGKIILDAGGEIDRAKLGRIVFSDPGALQQLENIVHPLVEQAIDIMVKRATQRVVVIEAIKLLEGPLAAACDTVWVTDAPEAIQKARLMKKRAMSEQEAIQRIQSQAPQRVKTDMAKVVIRNTGSFEDTWAQVVAAWKTVSPTTDTGPIVIGQTKTGEYQVQRGGPRDSARIAELITRSGGGGRLRSQEDVMAAFGEKAFLLLVANGQLVGLAGWQVENLVSRTTDLHLDPAIPVAEALKAMLSKVESASQDLQCEACLVFPSPALAAQEEVWKELGYTHRTAQTLGVQAWQEAAIESQPADTILFFKQLRMDRVLRPI